MRRDRLIRPKRRDCVIETIDILEALRRGDLAGATTLRIPSGVDHFPREIFGLADTLELLDLSGGRLTDLPQDFGRLHRLRVLFCSGNRFERLPASLGDCVALSQIGFRGSGLREIPAESLPPALRWLTITDNRIERLPSALGERPHLQKLMLSGNRLQSLPDSLANAKNLELLRLSANGFESLPTWIGSLPRLAWISFAGNPFERLQATSNRAEIPWHRLEIGSLLGEGASGRVHGALYRVAGQAPRPVAVKLFKGAMTSDGLPEREIAACLTAGTHPHLAGGLARLTGHPDSSEGLVMPLLPASWQALAGPPSLASCSRDVYDPALRLDAPVAIQLVCSAAAGAAHLHAQGILHGDLYAHNLLWDGTEGRAVLSDFGAASLLPEGEAGDAYRRIEVRAIGLLLGEVLDRCPEPTINSRLRALERDCTHIDATARPTMGEVLAVLENEIADA